MISRLADAVGFAAWELPLRLARRTARLIHLIGAAWWWSVRRHMCDLHGLPPEAAGEPPADWLRETPLPRKPRAQADAYGRWTLR